MAPMRTWMTSTYCIKALFDKNRWLQYRRPQPVDRHTANVGECPHQRDLRVSPQTTFRLSLVKMFLIIRLCAFQPCSDVSNNRFTGPLDASLTQLTSIQALWEDKGCVRGIAITFMCTNPHPCFLIFVQHEEHDRKGWFRWFDANLMPLLWISWSRTKNNKTWFV